MNFEPKIAPAPASEDLSRYLNGRSFEECWQQFQDEGYIIFENALSPEEVEEQRAALEPWIGADVRGRNTFEGEKSNRVYAMLAKDPVFADLISHPLQLAFGDRELGETMLLYACLAINLLPGETPQPWHFDDSHCQLPRPRPPLSMSTFWSISDTTEENGATEIIPGSHKWGNEQPEGANTAEDFVTGTYDETKEERGNSAQAIKATMPAGSLMIAKGTLWHRGGANVSDAPRLIVTPQFCTGWCRPLEQQLLAVPKEMVAQYPQRVRDLLGYSIHKPFMGYVDGMHPEKVLEAQK
ncbi:phytanoyl-CoA dioxygenase family protein [Alterisphingorhabdus coralli]|uniref:Phytanoyl-CoA dioxygenase family protein n=1 Tax=Alterisphingorhabdus coralli TaxID=3071408 RepID=A0AA97F7Z7_9SPHN|nr:phytanoyl-CoA dioxygenase family protein [Parasphingorhabdus sp. SCSIO 66989]WOE75658.1 phytanoyl-CoA dioxygenase family protein [Parasphingorhabdus sp. SCSIO 66989]